MDIHFKKTVYVMQKDSGEEISRGSVPTGAEGFRVMLENWSIPEETKVGLETGSQSWWVSGLLSGMGMRPVVIDAREVRSKARRINQKSDFRDAFEICDGLRRGIYTAIVYVPEPAILRLRQVLSRRRHFVRLCTSQVNATKYLLRSVGLSGEAAFLKSEGAWQKLMERSAIAGLRQYLAMHQDIWLTAQQKVQTLEKELADALGPFSNTANLLQSVPGIGPITAASYIAVLGTPERFSDSSHVVSYIGLAVSTYSSGQKERYGHITKRGSGELRMLLCEAAHHATNPRHPLSPYFRRVAARQGYKKAVVAVAQRLARILFQMWRKGQAFDIGQLNVVTEGRLRARRVYWRIRQSSEQMLKI
jgi:transposase